MKVHFILILKRMYLIKWIRILTLALICLWQTFAFSQVHWSYGSNKHVLKTSKKSWDAGIVFLPTVIKDGDTLKMWYTGSKGNYLTADPLEIGYAWSFDGINWTKYSGNPVLSPRSGKFDAGGIAAPVVIRDGDTLRMWYAAIGAGEPEKIPPPRTGYAWSLDGIHWNTLSEPVLENGPEGSWDDLICNPGGVIKENGLFKMWYWGATYLPGWPNYWPYVLAQIGLATSTDGVHWTKYDDPETTEPLYQFSDPVIKAEPWTANPMIWGQARVYLAAVLPTDTGYEMWISGLHPVREVEGGYPSAIAYFSSTDGIHWNKYADNPVLEPTYTWCSSIEFSTVILDGDQYRMWFSAEVFPDAGIAYATAPVAKPEAIITAVKDVANDQGRQVRVTWNSSRFDGIDASKKIVEYNLWRKASGIVKKNTALRANVSKAEQINLVKQNRGQIEIAGILWDFIATIPARQFARYSYIAPTLGDATATDTTFSTFMVSAHTENIEEYYDSEPFSGFSVDNLAPGVPTNFVGQETSIDQNAAVKLTWDQSEDEDFAYFALYKDELSEPIAKTINLEYVDLDVAIGQTHSYKLTAFDFAGNESQAAEISVIVTEVSGSALSEIPSSFCLRQNYPNPFNPETIIKFDVPIAAPIQISIFNALGQKVRTLVDKVYPAGSYTLIWNARDEQGTVVPSGVYFYKLKSGTIEQMQKMILLR